MKKCSFLLCVVLALVNSSQADRYVTSRKTPQRLKAPVVRILETSYLIQKSQQTLASVELVLQQAYDIADASISGSYSQLQREQLDIQFQKLLTLVDPMVEMSEFQGQSLLNADGQDIVIRFGRDILRFEATDITLAGLNLEDAALPAFEPNPMQPTAYEIIRETFFKIEAAVRKIKQLRLQFADYHNTVCKYLPYLKPNDSAEVRLGFEIVQASKATAEDIKARLEWASALANESINGPYSPQQRNIMNNEFEYCLRECTVAAEKVCFGMGIIDGQTQLSVNTRRQTLEFAGFDLTTAALGLDGDLSIETIENAQSALPYVALAIESVRQTINTLTEYEQTLSEHLGDKQVTGPGNSYDQSGQGHDRLTRPQPSQVRQPVQHPTAISSCGSLIS